MIPYHLIRPLLFSLPPEYAHHVTLEALKLKARFCPAREIPEVAPVNLMGIQFPNRIGLAAGLDKNGDYIDALATLGFGFIEIGTVTPRPQPGNPKPRLHRLVGEEALINRMGFNNKGIDYLVSKVQKSHYQGILGINIGKNADTPIASATRDYLVGLEKAYAVASYITVNISSPNTKNLRTLQNSQALQELLSALKEKQLQLEGRYQRYVPLVVKIAPDLSEEEVASLASTVGDCEFDAVIATNTSLDRSMLQSPESTGSMEGGLSGKPILQASNRVLRELRAALKEHIPIIGCGGIDASAAAAEKIACGADLLQIYTGMIYKGPDLVHELQKGTQY